MNVVDMERSMPEVQLGSPDPTRLIYHVSDLNSTCPTTDSKRSTPFMGVNPTSKTRRNFKPRHPLTMIIPGVSLRTYFSFGWLFRTIGVRPEVFAGSRLFQPLEGAKRAYSPAVPDHLGPVCHLWTM